MVAAEMAIYPVFLMAFLRVIFLSLLSTFLTVVISFISFFMASNSCVLTGFFLVVNSLVFSLHLLFDEKFE